MSLYGLIIGIAILIGIAYFERHQKIIPDKKLSLFEFGLIVSAIIGARAYHVVDQWSYYSYNLTLIPQTWRGGLGIFGALIGAIIYIFLFTKFSLPTVYRLLESIVPVLPLCQGIGRLGNWINQENPVWWTEAIGDLLIFFFIQKFPKNATAKYLLGYGGLRFLTEFWRNDTWVYQNLKVGQIISLLFIVTGLWLLQKITPPPSPKH